jgi:hypothetical protein
MWPQKWVFQRVRNRLPLYFQENLSCKVWHPKVWVPPSSLSLHSCHGLFLISKNVTIQAKYASSSTTFAISLVVFQVHLHRRAHKRQQELDPKHAHPTTQITNITHSIDSYGFLLHLKQNSQQMNYLLMLKICFLTTPLTFRQKTNSLAFKTIFFLTMIWIHFVSKA